MRVRVRVRVRVCEHKRGARCHARVLALAKEHQWTTGIEKYKTREVLSTGGPSGWWVLAILR